MTIILILSLISYCYVMRYVDLWIFTDLIFHIHLSYVVLNKLGHKIRKFKKIIL